MKKYLLSIASLLLFFACISVFADSPESFYTKPYACSLSDNQYKWELSVLSDDPTAVAGGFIKSGNILYYVVISENHTKQELFSYDCKKKKSNLIKDVTLNSSKWMNAEIDYINTSYIFIKYSGEARWEEYEGVFTRRSKVFRELTFANRDTLMNQHKTDFGSDALPFRVVDVTTGRWWKLLVWITWWPEALRALSLDTKTFIASNVTWNYTFRMQNGSDAWLKLSNGKLYGRGNAGWWYELQNRDISTFRALTAEYGRDNFGHSISFLDPFLPADALFKSHELWYSPSKQSLYGYHFWSTYSVAVKNPRALVFTGYTQISSPVSICDDTTGSYSYEAYDDQFCYGNLYGTSGNIGIVWKVKK